MQYIYQTKKKNIEIAEKNWLNFPPHLHYHIELSFVINGSCSAFADGNTYQLTSGDIFITFPNQVHFFTNSSSDMDAFVLQLSPQAFPEYERVISTQIPASPLIKYDNPDYISALITNTHQVKGIFHDTIIRSYCSIILGTLFNVITFVNSISLDTNTINQIVNYCNKNYNENISLQSISEHLHISTWRISHIFNEDLNINFRKYINTLRLNKAEDLLLNSSLSVIEIAYSVGFENIRTFNRCFLSKYGCSPTAYREENSRK